ncbi:MAG: RsiV family protein [Bacteroidota bacterium]
MRAFFFGLIPILLLACNNKAAQEKEPIEIVYQDEEQAQLNIPEGCELDSLSFEEKELRLTVRIIAPKCIDPKLDNSFQSLLKDWLDWGRANAKSVLEKRKASGVFDERYCSMNLYPEFFYSDSSWVSYRFYTSWNEEAIHPLPGYLSFTYFIPENRKVEFQDLFVLDSPRDSANFMSVISAHLEKAEHKLSHLYPFEFNLEEDAISFNFGPYELGAYASGMPRAVVPKADLIGFLKEKYR